MALLGLEIKFNSNERHQDFACTIYNACHYKGEFFFNVNEGVLMLYDALNRNLLQVNTNLLIIAFLHLQHQLPTYLSILRLSTE